MRYIGKTSGDIERRLVAHISEARRGGRNHKSRWVHSLLKRNEQPKILALITVDGDGCFDERCTIAAFRAAPFIRLANHTDGGEGRPGVRRTEAEKEFLSRLHKGRKITWGDKISAAKRGRKFTEAHKEARYARHGEGLSRLESHDDAMLVGQT